MSTGNTATSPARFPQPVRAITSTISARASPSVPLASQTYEPLARAVLRRRLLYHILPQSSLTVWASTTFWVTWHAGGVSTLPLSKLLVIPFLPTTILVTFLVWAFGVLPIIVLRKSRLTGEYAKLAFLVLILRSVAVSAPSSSPSQRVKVAFSDPSTLRALSVYITAGICVSALNILVCILQSASGDRDLWIFAKSKCLFLFLEVFSDSHPIIQETPLLSKWAFSILVHVTSFFDRGLSLPGYLARPCGCSLDARPSMLPFECLYEDHGLFPAGLQDGYDDGLFLSTPSSWHHHWGVHSCHVHGVYDRFRARAFNRTPHTIPDSISVSSISTIFGSLPP